MIVATGGISYPSTGSTGDGYRFAKETGHRVTELLPSLVPMSQTNEYAEELQGLHLQKYKNHVEWKSFMKKFGEMLFYIMMATGPVILSGAVWWKNGKKTYTLYRLKTCIE